MHITNEINEIFQGRSERNYENYTFLCCSVDISLLSREKFPAKKLYESSVILFTFTCTTASNKSDETKGLKNLLFN